MTATCLNTKGIEAVLRICCCASGSIVFHGRKTTALSLTVSTALNLVSLGGAVKDTRRAELVAPVDVRALPCGWERQRRRPSDNRMRTTITMVGKDRRHRNGQ